MKYWILEDEHLAAKRLRRMVRDLKPDYQMTNEVDTIEDFLNDWNSMEHPDFIFMDIHLSDGLSLEIFSHTEVNTPVIFTTAYDEHAIEAFSANAIDYILKPIKKEKLESAINKLEQQEQMYATQKEVLKKLSGEVNEISDLRFLAKVGQKLKLVRASDVAYFYTESKITFACTKNDHRYPLDFSLEQLDEKLSSKQFFRINRQYIINIDAIDEMHTYSKSRVKIILSPKAPSDTIVSTDRSRNFKDWLEGK